MTNLTPRIAQRNPAGVLPRGPKESQKLNSTKLDKQPPPALGAATAPQETAPQLPPPTNQAGSAEVMMLFYSFQLRMTKAVAQA